MVTCPHCGYRSISLLQKFFSSRSRPIECQHCSGLSATQAVAHYQFIVGVIYLAIFPNLLVEATLHLADIVVLTVIFGIKLVAPMTESSVVG